MGNAIKYIPCLVFAAGTAFLIHHGYGAMTVLAAGFGTFLLGASAMDDSQNNLD